MFCDSKTGVKDQSHPTPTDLPQISVFRTFHAGAKETGGERDGDGGGSAGGLGLLGQHVALARNAATGGQLISERLNEFLGTGDKG